ncbi:MAG TPA: DUF255 domain-containing protein [Planctomycetota bacterium]|jgi:hypothetical protein
MCKIVLSVVCVTFAIHAGTLPGQKAEPFAPTLADPALLHDSGVIRWRTFGAEALAEAQRQSKPIFLFVTCNCCPRGRAMERTTFSDEVVATRINEDYVAVRLDRDHRPDIEIRLQQALQALQSSRGLPLCAVLTPEGRVFFAGTFLSAEEDPLTQRQGLKSTLQRLSAAWRENRSDLVEQAGQLDAAICKAREKETTSGDVPGDLLQRVLPRLNEMLRLQSGAAPAHAGLFPAPRALALSLEHYARTRDKRSLESATAVLDAMLRGGIYDPLEGGFYRCSTDGLWRVPRFEKVLGTNAEMIGVLAQAWSLTQEERYRRAAEETLAFWMGTMDAGDGLFFGSQAGGNSDLDDGHFCTWTVREVESVLRDDEDCRLAKVVYDIGELGDLPLTAPYRNVLFDALPIEQAAQRCGMTPDKATRRLQGIRTALAAARTARKAPAIDRSVYVDSNALMSAALMTAGRAFNRSDLTDRGSKALRMLLEKTLVKNATGMTGIAHVLGPEAAQPPVFLQQDEAALAYACAIAFQATQQKEFRDAAEASLRRVFSNFWDQQAGGCFDRCGKPELAGLSWNLKLSQDTAEPSGNGLAALACATLDPSTKGAEFREPAERILAAFGSVIESFGPHAATLVSAQLLLHPEQLPKQNPK